MTEPQAQPQPEPRPQTLLTLLYCPASRSDRFEKALRSGADAVIYDLEDAVAPADKDRARAALAEYLQALAGSDAPRPHVQVRVNAVHTPWFADDLRMIADAPAVDSIRVPKVGSATELDELAAVAQAGTRVHALLETARGVENALEICSVPFVSGVSLGEADLVAELRLTGSTVLNQLRGRLVVAAAAAGIAAPMGAAYLNVRDEAGLLADTRELARLGFLGRTALHPAQLAPIRAAFRPNEEALARATAILESIRRTDAVDDLGASALADGTFIDAPVIARARQLVELAERTRGPGEAG